MKKGKRRGLLLDDERDNKSLDSHLSPPLPVMER
jgi:hypothetical protein